MDHCPGSAWHQEGEPLNFLHRFNLVFATSHSKHLLSKKTIWQSTAPIFTLIRFFDGKNTHAGKFSK